MTQRVSFASKLKAFPLYLLGMVPIAFVFALVCGASLSMAFGYQDHVFAFALLVGSAFGLLLGLFTYSAAVDGRYSSKAGKHATAANRPAGKNYTAGNQGNTEWSPSPNGSEKSTVINPATGLAMMGGMAGVDALGNTYGQDRHMEELRDSAADDLFSDDSTGNSGALGDTGFDNNDYGSGFDSSFGDSGGFRND